MTKRQEALGRILRDPYVDHALERVMSEEAKIDWVEETRHLSPMGDIIVTFVGNECPKAKAVVHVRLVPDEILVSYQFGQNINCHGHRKLHRLPFELIERNVRVSQELDEARKAAKEAARQSDKAAKKERNLTRTAQVCMAELKQLCENLDKEEAE